MSATQGGGTQHLLAPQPQADGNLLHGPWTFPGGRRDWQVRLGAHALGLLGSLTPRIQELRGRQVSYVTQAYHEALGALTHWSCFITRKQKLGRSPRG